MRNRKVNIIRNLEHDYDEVNDLLYIYKKNTKVYSNVMIGDFNLEFTKNGELAGIEILNASGILEEFKIHKKILENIRKVDLKVVARGSSLLIFMIIYSDKTKSEATITMNNLEPAIMEAIAAA
jgi:uncharacterized protein YuzE